MAGSVASFLGDFSDYFAVFGAIAVSYVTLKFLLSVKRGVVTYFLAKPLGLSKDLKKAGQWAVVTGATDGIGKAYAQQLAQKGLDVVLISRNPEKLSDVAQEIERTSSVKTKCVAVDFSTQGMGIYDKIKKELSTLDIGVLVNNVGMGQEHPDFYGNLDDSTVQRLIVMNCNSVAHMTSLLLPGMVERRRGVIINLSSASALKPCGTPMLGLYGATKAFVDSFSQALDYEYSPKGITVQSVKPFFVATNLSKIRRTNFLVPSPTNYVRQALATVGIENLTFGYLSHALQGYVVLAVPDCITNYVTMKQMLGVRKRALKRQQDKKD